MISISGGDVSRAISVMPLGAADTSISTSTATPRTRNRSASVATNQSAGSSAADSVVVKLVMPSLRFSADSGPLLRWSMYRWGHVSGKRVVS